MKWTKPLAAQLHRPEPTILPAAQHLHRTATNAVWCSAGVRVDGTRYYVLKDHLGSASVVTNQSATVVGQDRFMPFGETRFTTGAMKTDKLFTGQREMAGLGIYHYGARFYSPKLGRFLSADTIVPGYGDPQSLNRFSYVLNNPLRYTDPTGHRECEDSLNCTLGNSTSTGTPGGNDSTDSAASGGSPGDSSLAETIVYEALYEFFYDPAFGGSSSGCNTWILMNGNGDYCHHTMYTPQLICLPVFHCSTDKQRDYALRFQYPGQLPWMPVVGGREERHVMGGDFIPWQWLLDKGAITVSIDGQTIINTTEKTHIFHQGDIYRTVSGGYVSTEGHGTNTNLAVAVMNQYGGPVAFESWDFLMTSFTTVDQLSNGVLVQWMNTLPPGP